MWSGWGRMSRGTQGRKRTALARSTSWSWLRAAGAERVAAPAAAASRWVYSTAPMVNWRHWLSRVLYTCSGRCGWALLYWGLPSKRCPVRQMQILPGYKFGWNVFVTLTLSLCQLKKKPQTYSILLYKKVSKLLKLLKKNIVTFAFSIFA